jgi:hypothetical protein
VRPHSFQECVEHAVRVSTSGRGGREGDNLGIQFGHWN